MKIFNNFFSRLSIFSIAFTIITIPFSCKKDDKVVVAPVIVPDQSFSQSFESMSGLTSKGWVLKTLSDTLGFGPGNNWRIDTITAAGQVPPYDGTHLLFDDYTSASDVSGNISDWVISPRMLFQNGDKISFYTLSNGSVDGFGDRLQLRLNTFNTSDSIGTKSTDVGHFTTPLLDINPLYKIISPGDYPSIWTKYEATISGLNEPDSGRFAIRYFVEVNGGANADEVAIDKLEFKSAGH